MRRLLAAFLLLVLTDSAAAFQPRTGHWWNPDESGSGYNIDIQDGVLVITVYSYQTGGPAQWYLASGPMTNDQHNFTGSLDKFVGGQCIFCPYAGRPTYAGSDGTISISFASETSATLTLPGGRVTQIQPFNFAIGDPPTGLLGEWVFVYDSGTNTLAQRYDFTTVLPPSSATGSGIASDPGRLGGCELQTGGPAAGLVVCAQIDAQGNVLYGYVFSFGLDQTYSGVRLSSAGAPQGAMKGFKVISRNGFSNTAAAGSAAIAEANATAEQGGAPAAAMQGALRSLAGAVARVSAAP